MLCGSLYGAVYGIVYVKFSGPESLNSTLDGSVCGVVYGVYGRSPGLDSIYGSVYGVVHQDCIAGPLAWTHSTVLFTVQCIVQHIK